MVVAVSYVADWLTLVHCGDNEDCPCLNHQKQSLPGSLWVRTSSLNLRSTDTLPKSFFILLSVSFLHQFCCLFNLISTCRCVSFEQQVSFSWSALFALVAAAGQVAYLTCKTMLKTAAVEKRSHCLCTLQYALCQGRKTKRTESTSSNVLHLFG